MSSSPFIKRAKARTNLRQRDETTPVSPLARAADDAGEDDEEMSISPMQMAKNRKKDKEKKKSGSIGKSRLSFGVEDEEASEEQPFVARKSKLSQSISLQKQAASSSLAGSGSNTGGDDYHNPFASTSTIPAASSSVSYNNAYLEELKASTPMKAPRARDADDEPQTMEIDDLQDPSAQPSFASSLSRYAPLLDTTQGIPDEAAIAAAKAKRKTATGTGISSSSGLGGEDYISIDQDNGKLAVFDADVRGDPGPHPESRLQREEDEEGEGDAEFADFTETNTRLAIGKDANKAAARRLRNDMVDAIDDREMEDLDDEDEMAWEMAQANRANPTIDAGPSQSSKSSRPYKAAPIPASRPLPTVTSASARLQASCAFLKSSRATRQSQIESADRELLACDTQEADLRAEVTMVEAKKEWMEEFRGWVEMLGGFLEEKMPILQKIEKDMMLHYKERHDIYTKRRMQDDADDLALCVGIVAPAQADEEEEIDEMGRTRRKVDESGAYSGVRRARREERAARRQRRNARRAQPKQDEDGYSTDSSLGEGDAEDYQTAQQALQARVQALSSDVKAEDFRDPELGLAVRFGGWRKQYEDEYSNAYGGLAMVQGWEYWARQEMIGWEPSRSDKSLDSFHWFDCLHRYSRPQIELPPADDSDDMDMDEEPPLSGEGDLAAAMISSSVTGIVLKAIEHGVYDVYSTRQTRKLADLLDVVAEYIGKDGQKYRGLLKALLTVFSTSILSAIELVASLTSPQARPPPAFEPASRTSLKTFTNRQRKIIKNLLLWRRYVPDEVSALVNRIILDILRPVLSRCWDSGGQAIAAELANGIPPGLLNPSATAFVSGMDQS